MPAEKHNDDHDTELDTERADSAYFGLDGWAPGDIIAAITDANRRAIEAVAKAGPELERAVEGIESRLAAGGRLVYAGAGTSGRLGVMDAAELAPTFGFDDVAMVLAGGGEAQTRAQEGAEDDREDARSQIDELTIGELDAVVGIAASGRTPFTVAAVLHARSRGAFTVGMANNAGTPLLSAGDVGVLLDSGPEVLAGSTRLAAGTAQKAALNAISTTVLVRLGGAYQNLMVGMRPLNAKLQQRAVKIVAQATGQSLSASEEALEEAAGDIRTAIVMSKAEVGFDSARGLLERSRSSVTAAIEAAREGD